jgi:hypothetical protein
LGYLLPPWSRCFQRTCAVFSQHRPPALSSPGSSSFVLYLLFRVHDRPYLALRFRATTTFHGVSFPIATSVQKVHFPTSFPRFVYDPPSMFLTSSTVCSFLHLVSLFRPTATSGIHLFRGFPRCSDIIPLRNELPLLPLAGLLLQLSFLNCPDPGASSSGFCSEQRSVALDRWFRSAQCPFPS